MKIILEDFNYKEVHFDHWEADLPQINDVEEVLDMKAKPS